MEQGRPQLRGLDYAVTTGDHVGYESWLERDRLVLLDCAPEVGGIASQPFWLHWREAGGKRRHAPDYFVRLADGRARVVDVRAENDVDGRTASRSMRPGSEVGAGGGVSALPPPP
ncbi:TnsA-like heteromeric transposase endonuclease subunit [Streptomyces hundungensis]|uniref:TnsA-like heteromeric transposase endonuclease subunit n=1 Tax=Streptomyces hundungensis TaxID=1077946 RepID=UPI0033CCB8FC